MKHLTKYQNPNTSVSNLRQEMDRIFSELIPFSWRFEDMNTDMGTWSPSTDMTETNDEYVIEMDLPGLTKNDLNINCQDNVLTIEGERKREKKTEQKGYLRNERNFGMFRRSIMLPTSILEDKIKAVFEDGVLRLTVPKSEKSKQKTITIE